MIIRSRNALQRFAVASAFVYAASFSSLASAAPLAIGTIESIDARSSSLVVLGQKFSVATATLVSGSKSYSAGKAAQFLAPGTLVWVDGELASNGTAKVASITLLPETNVPGSTQVFVAGVVKAVDSTGKVKIGSLTIDTTPTIGTFEGTISVGDSVEFLGVQPAANGLFVASAVADLRVQGVGGTGLNGVGGTGLAGVGGTGTSGVGGTGVKGVGGTGKSGVGGTGLTGVGGTGVAGVGGTGVAGVGGTGLAGVGGTGKSGVGGTGLTGVGGTGKAGVGGTGVAGVGGTGVAGVGGTGLAGVGGTGTAGVGGTGVKGVGGTGKSGVGGTGLTGVGGTGLTGVGGTGLTGVGGTGIKGVGGTGAP